MTLVLEDRSVTFGKVRGYNHIYTLYVCIYVLGKIVPFLTVGGKQLFGADSQELLGDKTAVGSGSVQQLR
jgi:hypothetical protein